jgi:ABC-type antimicrobial peptide transport system permease subunit
VFVVALLGLWNSLTTSVLERRAEIATLRAIGLRDALARRIIVVEGLMVAVVGLALAAIGGWLLALMWTTRTFQLLLGWSLVVRVPWLTLATLAIIALGVCHATSCYSARRAERLDLMDGLRAPS